MSKRSQFKINQRVREGDEGKRRAQMYVLRTLTEKVADIVAAKLKNLVIQEVHNELDRRGYPQETQACDRGGVLDSQPPTPGLDKEREDTVPPVEKTPEGEGCPSKTVEEGDLCPSCGKDKVIRDQVFSNKIICPNCQSNWKAIEE